MPSMVLLMRSRLRIRPLSFSMRMPRSSWYWRLILRRPASSLGRSASSSCSSTASPKPEYRSFLEDLVLRTLAMVKPDPPSSNRTDVAAGLLAHGIEALAPVTRKQRHLAFRPAGRTQALALELAAALFRRL